MFKHTKALVAAGAISVLALAGCSAPSDAGADASGEKKDITISVFHGWDEGVATSVLWQAILEEKGYNVELEYADVAPVFTGLASGDYDFTTNIWMPGTHKEYVEKYGADMVDLGAWNEESKLTLAVNADAPINSIAELAANAELFGNTIVGIEPGAGLTAAMENSVIPGYGLEGMKFVTSSTPAMLSELKAATDAGENVVVTLWEPQRAYGQFPLKNLEDPKGALGGTEGLHTYSSTAFPENSPIAAGWLEGFEMDTEMLYSLQNALFVDYEGSDYGPAIATWIAANQAYVDSLTAE